MYKSTAFHNHNVADDIFAVVLIENTDFIFNKNYMHFTFSRHSVATDISVSVIGVKIPLFQNMVMLHIN